MKRFEYYLLYFSCLFLFFEAALRSIGYATLGPSIQLAPAVFLSDFGLLMPIAIQVVLGDIGIFLKSRITVFSSICLAYGMILFVVRHNPVPHVGDEIRLYLAILCGISLVALSQARIPRVAATIAGSCLMLVTLSVIALFWTPVLYVSKEGARTTNAISYIFLGPPLVLCAPAIILSHALRSKMLISLSWISLCILFLEALLISQTRTHVLAAIISTLLAIFSVMKLPHRKSRPFSLTFRRLALFLTAFSVLASTISLAWMRKDSFANFSERMLSALQDPSVDGSIKARLDEIDIVFRSMNSLDMLIGKGLNPPPILEDFQGYPYNAMHIGILNFGWRFGLPAFLILCCYICMHMLRWLRILPQRARPRDPRRLAYLICMPGGITFLFISLTSGAWAPQPMLGLGILIGLFSVIANGNIPLPSAAHRGSLSSAYPDQNARSQI